MASTALVQFNTAVDNLAVSAARKDEIKNVGERLYIAGARETIAHLRKHVEAVADDTGQPPAVRTRASNWLVMIDGMLSSRTDDWWLDIQALAET